MLLGISLTSTFLPESLADTPFFIHNYFPHLHQKVHLTFTSPSSSAENKEPQERQRQQHSLVIPINFLSKSLYILVKFYLQYHHFFAGYISSISVKSFWLSISIKCHVSLSLGNKKVTQLHTLLSLCECSDTVVSHWQPLMEAEGSVTDKRNMLLFTQRPGAQASSEVCDSCDDFRNVNHGTGGPFF